MTLSFSSLPAGDADQSAASREAVLNERARTGDRQALLDLYELLQERIFRRATRYVQLYRQSIPWYLDAQDLAQEANLAMYHCLDEAASKDQPIAYLLGAGYGAIRYAWVQALQESRLVSLDRPRSQDNPALLHEFIPAPTNAGASATQDERKQELLSEMLSHLPCEQRTILAHRLGLDDQVVGTVQETAHWVQQSTGSTFRKERKAYATLLYRLAPFFPQYAERVVFLEQAYAQACEQGTSLSAQRFAQAMGISHEEAIVFLYEREGAPCQTRRALVQQQARQRLERAYTDLFTPGRAMAIRTLARRAGTDDRTARQYLLEHEGARRLLVQQRLEQAYTDLLMQGQHITVSALALQAGTQRKAARTFLHKREGTHRLTPQTIAHQDAIQRLAQAFNELRSQGQPITVSELAKLAGTTRTTARKYLKQEVCA